MKDNLLLLVFSFTIVIYSCGRTNSNDQQAQDTTADGNVSTTISEDTAKLGRLLNFSLYKPTNVKFKYVFIDNSGQNQRISVLGPSDSYLEAVLYFDSLVFSDFKSSYFNADYTAPNFNKEQFNFEWLDKSIKDELIQSDTAYHGHPDFFLGTGINGRLWFLDKKILVYKSSS